MKRIGKLITKIDGGTLLYMTSVKKIKSLTRRWPRNRPEDETRVREITESMETATIVDGIVHVWDSTGEGDTLFVFDGWTRLCAAMRLKRDIRVLLAVNITRNEDEIVGHFNRLNMAVPVPLIYTQETACLKRRVLLEEVTGALVKMYKPVVSAARSPRKPNFNRDSAFEMLDRILPRELDSRVTVISVINWLKDINEHLKRSDQVWPEKAVRVECFLFCVAEDLLGGHLRVFIDNENLDSVEVPSL